MLSITARVDAKQVLAALARERKQVPFATALAINAVAKQIIPAERKLIGSVFEHPRPFTVNSVIVPKGDRATKTKLSTRIIVQDKTAAYLDAYEFGGAHYLPNRPELGRVILEPVHMPVDAYGQIRKKQLVTILARPDVFVGTVHGILGIWQRVKPAPKPRQRRFRLIGPPPSPAEARPRLILLAKVIPNRAVPKHLGFIEQGLDLAEYLMPMAFAEAFEKAMATAK